MSTYIDENTADTPEPESTEVRRLVLASRWKRLGASILDSLILAVFTVPAMFLTGGFSGISEGVEPSFLHSLLMGLLGLVVFFALNFKFLGDDGQTIGKKVLGIKIVDTQGDKALWKPHLLARYAVFFLPGQIPLAGQLFSIVNVLFIFGNDKRCLHDYAAKTIVIDC